MRISRSAEAELGLAVRSGELEVRETGGVSHLRFGPVKSFWLLFLFLSHTPSHLRSPAVFSGGAMRRNSPIVVLVQPTSSVRVTSSSRCCPPNISPLTSDHDDVFQFPAIGGGG